MAQLIWLWGCPTYAQKQAKNAFLVFLGCFWAFVGQPHNYIGWARPMPFVSINSTNPRTNPWNFHRKKFENLPFWKMAILKNRPFWIFFIKKKFFFCFIVMKISPNLCGRMDGSKFWCFTWFQENSLLCVIFRYTVYLFNFMILRFKEAYSLAKVTILNKENNSVNVK